MVDIEILLAVLQEINKYPEGISVYYLCKSLKINNNLLKIDLQRLRYFLRIFVKEGYLEKVDARYKQSQGKPHFIKNGLMLIYDGKKNVYNIFGCEHMNDGTCCALYNGDSSKAMQNCKKYSKLPKEIKDNMKFL